MVQILRPLYPYFCLFKSNLFMKKILLIAVFVPLAGFLLAQTSLNRNFDLNNTAEMLTRLFDADTVNADGEALWEPLNYADELSAELSDDEWIHTRLDTMLFYEAFSVERAVAVFETLHYNHGSVEDCQTCGAQISVAIFDKTADGKWLIQRFSKHLTTLGAFGNDGTVGLAQFGENQWCLSLQMSWLGQGIYGEYLTFLNLEDMEKVFNLTIHEDNSGVLAGDSDQTYSFDRAVHLLPSVETTNGWWEFDLVTQGTQADDDVQRAVPANMVERFAFNQETGTYMKVCQ